MKTTRKTRRGTEKETISKEGLGKINNAKMMKVEQMRSLSAKIQRRILRYVKKIRLWGKMTHLEKRQLLHFGPKEWMLQGCTCLRPIKK